MAFLLLILLAIPLCSQSSSEQNKSSMTCYTDAELAEIDAGNQKILEEAIVEAVNVAVAPYQANEIKLSARIDSLELWNRVLIGTTSAAMVAFLVTLFILRLSTVP